MTSPLSSSAADRPADAPSARRLAVLGLGRAGIAYAMAAARQPDCELAGLVDPRPARRAFARGAGFAVPAAATLERLLATTRVDGVIVASPLAERLPAIEAAHGAGLAVMVDGLPVAHPEGAGRLEPLLESAQAPMACATGVLFHPLFARASQVLASDAVGALREVRASVYVSRVFAAGANPAQGDVLDFAVAELLMLLDTMFGPAGRVSASGQRLYGGRLDEVHASVELPGGIAAGVDGSWSVPGYPRASLVVEVIAERGAVLVSDDALEADLPRAVAGVPAGHTRRVLADEPDPIAFEGGEAARALAAFAPALAGGALAAVLDIRRALRVARTLDALRKAAGGASRAAEPVT